MLLVAKYPRRTIPTVQQAPDGPAAGAAGGAGAAAGGAGGPVVPLTWEELRMAAEAGFDELLRQQELQVS